MSSRYQGGIIRPGYNGLRVTCAPPSIVATAGNSNCACVSVGCPSGQCFAGVTSYTVYANCNKIANTSASSPIVVSGLTSGSSYSFRAVATNTYGPSLPSSSSNSITAQLLGSQSYTTAGTYSWVAPSGVTSVSVVAIGGGAGTTSNCSNGWGLDSYFCRSCLVRGGGGNTSHSSCFPNARKGGTHTGDGGGNGGDGHAAGGGGGAGGYSGAGGNGGACASCCSQRPGASGSGGGGGGGGSFPLYGGAGGGGVGLFGQGCNGSGGGYSGFTGYGGGGGSGGGAGGNGTKKTHGNGGTGYSHGGVTAPNGGYYNASSCTTSRTSSGGGYGGFNGSNYNGGGGGGGGAFGGGGGSGAGYGAVGGGGGLGYKNNITVVPGNSYTVVVGSGGRSNAGCSCFGGGGSGGSGAVRIVWPGNTRTFPSTNVGTP